MPKGKRKNKTEHRRTEQVSSSDEDMGIDMTLDNMSETSGQSDLRSNHDEVGSVILNQRRMPLTTKEKRIFKKAIKPVRNTDQKDDSKARSLIWISGMPKLDYVRDEIENGTFKIGPIMDKMNSDRMAWYGHIQNEDHEWEMLDESVPSKARDNEAQEKFEEKVLELVDALGARANAARAAALVGLRAALQRRPLDHVLAAHRATLADHLARALRRGRDAERRAAAAVAPLVALQVGEEGLEEFVTEVRQALVATAVDASATVEARTECCSSLAVLCYVLEEDITEILEVMRVYETIFSGSYLKGDGSVKVSGAAVEAGGWHAAALDGWALLLGALPPEHAPALMARAPGFARLAGLLAAHALEVRLAAGGALAVAHERVAAARGGGPEAEPEELAAALPRLRALACDSHKYRAKRDRKLQRATFREILKYFEEGSVAAERVRVGAESVCTGAWARRAAYAALAGALGAALQPLAARAGALRAALGLPAEPPHADATRAPRPRLNKLQRHLQNAAADKARTVARAKNRDKRTATLAL